MNCGPFSQEQLETLRAASSQISKTWDQLVEPIKKFGEKYGTAQISEDMKEKRDKLDEKHKRSKEKSTGEAGNASGADGLSGNGQGADSDQLGT